MRKVVFICITVLSLIVYCDLVSASMTGTWSTERVETSRLKMKGAATQTEVKSILDTWIFNGDGSFTSDDYTGTWSQRGASFSVNVDAAQIEAFIEARLLAEDGITVSATVRRVKASGSEKKDGTMKGTYVIQATVVDGSGGAGTLTINGKFQGVLPFSAAEYFPLDQGDTWTYTSAGVRNGEPFEDEPWSQTISGTANVGHEVYAKMLEDDGDYTLFSNSNGVKTAEEYEIGNDGGSSLESVDTFKPPVEYIPARFSIGTTHTFKAVLNHRDSSGLKATANIDGQSVVEGVESIAVPAGNFADCVRIRVTRNLTAPTMNHSESSDMTIWLARGIGIVKQTSSSVETSGEQVDTQTDTDELISTNLGL
jgi:hypothetical protein